MPSSKPFTVIECEQRSDAWRQARLGVFTASRAYDAFRKTVKGEWRAERTYYRTELVLERLTGRSAEDGYQSQAMINGIKREADAIRIYENVHGVMVRSVGFVLDNEIPIGCSPDGVIGDFEGLVQVKSPNPPTHLATLRTLRNAQRHERIARAEDKLHMAAVAPEYLAQVRHELYVTGALWCDYVSYHPDFPAHLQLVTIRVTAADANVVDYSQDVRVFLQEVEQECEQIASWQ